MQTTKNYKTGIGCISMFLVFLVIGFIYVSYMGYAIVKMAYIYEVSAKYMTYEKRKTGKWPNNLDDFPRYYVSQHNGDMRGSRIEFHLNNYESMEILQSDDKRCRFRLHLRGFWGFYPHRSVVEEDEAIIK